MLKTKENTHHKFGGEQRYQKNNITLLSITLNSQLKNSIWSVNIFYRGNMRLLLHKMLNEMYATNTHTHNKTAKNCTRDYWETHSLRYMQ